MKHFVLLQKHMRQRRKMDHLGTMFGAAWREPTGVPRRTARVAAILRALGAHVPRRVDGRVA